MPERLVVDCSVAAKWILPEPGRDAALGLLKQYETGEILLIAPDLLLAEFASLLAKRTRRKELSAREDRYAFDLMQRFAPRLFDMRSRIQRAFSIALQHHLSLWDCVYIDLAIEHSCSVITADKRLFRGTTARHASLRLLR